MTLLMQSDFIEHFSHCQNLLYFNNLKIYNKKEAKNQQSGTVYRGLKSIYI